MRRAGRRKRRTEVEPAASPEQPGRPSAGGAARAAGPSGVRRRSATRRPAVVLACAAVLVLLLGACGGDGEGADAAAGVGEVSGTSASPDDGSDGSATDDTGVPTTTDAASIPADPSAGCAAGGPLPAEEGRVDTAAGDGTPRWYLRDLPTGYDGATPAPLVVDLHGYSEGAEVHRAHTLLHELGDQEGFVTVTPHGQGPVPRWEASAGSADSVWFGELLDELEADLCLDRNRLFVAGLSNGAFMTSTVACDHADRIAAAAPVAGIVAPEDCDAARPVPVVAFHGTEDTFVAFDGGLGSSVAELPSPDGQGTMGDDVSALEDEADEVGAPIGPSVPEATAAWAGRNGCETDPVEEAIAEDVTIVTFDCPPGAEARLYRVEGGGHTWPGAQFLATATDLVGTTTFSIDANEIIWSFFEQHPLGVTG